MLCCCVKFRNGCVRVCRTTKKNAWKMFKDDDIVQITVYKNGRVCADYIKTIHY